jgi:hypothetical protein
MRCLTSSNKGPSAPRLRQDAPSYSVKLTSRTLAALNHSFAGRGLVAESVQYSRVQHSTKDCRCRLSCKPFPRFYGISVSAPASHPSRRSNMTTVAAHPPETNGGIVTSWLPLTSAWPSVAECVTGGIYSQIGANGALAIAYDPYYGMSIDRSLTCLPPFATAWWSQTTTTPLLTHTSLGPFVCPGGYTTATSSVVNDISTFVGCCPS